MLKYKLLTSLIGVILMTVPLIVNVSASTGMGGDPPGKGQDNPQPDRVGNEDEKDRDGPGGESAESDDEGEANYWGKVTSDFTNQKDGDGGGGQAFGGHASDPVPGDDDNETPREGVGNQDEDHPSDHADTVGPRFGSDEECTED
jgi:hypothetical protein